jgi:hypothetical protein
MCLYLSFYSRFFFFLLLTKLYWFVLPFNLCIFIQRYKYEMSSTQKNISNIKFFFLLWSLYFKTFIHNWYINTWAFFLLHFYGNYIIFYVTFTGLTFKIYTGLYLYLYVTYMGLTFLCYISFYLQMCSKAMKGTN